jgi:hypothetical protein
MNSIATIIVDSSVRVTRTLTVCAFLIAPIAFGAPPPVTVDQPVKVEVVNPTPIPVTGTVAITHQGPVDVILAGNGPEAPLHVQPPLQTPWRSSFFLSFAAGSRVTTGTLTNNSGARLMIQQITTSGRIQPGGAYQCLDIGIRSAPPKAALTGTMGILKPTLDGINPFTEALLHDYSASSQVTLYLEPGEELVVTAVMSAPGGFAWATVAGLILY